MFFDKSVSYRQQGPSARIQPETNISERFLPDTYAEGTKSQIVPLCVLTFRWNYFFHELNPMGYHAVNVFLPTIVCVMFYNLCRIFLRANSSFVEIQFLIFCMLLDWLSSVFFLAAFTCNTKAISDRSHTMWLNMYLVMVSVAIAMLCKERGITVTGVGFVYEIFVAQNMSE